MKENNASGIGITGLLGLIFVTLKLTGYIDWSWWWVTFPFWGPPLIVICLGVTYALFGMWLKKP